MPESATGIEERRRLAQGQAHHAGVAAFKPGNEYRAEALYGVRPGLVHRLAARPVIPAFGFAERAKCHACLADRRLDAPFIRKRHCGQHAVAPARQRSEHADCISFILRLAKDFLANRDSRVRCEHRQVTARGDSR
jgi:hypothetical protein